MKRGCDIAIASLALVFLAPLLLALWALVSAGLGAPALFQQSRAGLAGRPFTLLKFRTMREGPGDDAERLTPFGRRLRATGLDELPQLWNILRGEMSLVGPRPLPLAYVPLYSSRQSLRLNVRPGLFGLAQAGGRNTLPWPEKLELDARYAEGRSPIGDLRIIWRCLRGVLRGEGTTAPGHVTAPPFTGGS